MFSYVSRPGMGLQLCQNASAVGTVIFIKLSFQEWTQQVQDMLNAKKFEDIAFRDKDYNNGAVEYYSKNEFGTKLMELAAVVVGWLTIFGCILSKDDYDGRKMLKHDPLFIPAMASSSNSSIHKTSFRYDVFLSFRGEDTRTNFVDHLYHALKQENIETYKDDENLERGKKISMELIQAIEDSRFHVIVFSKNYASSSWCLDELVKIMECQNTKTGQIVYPIFYDVEPTQVRKQSGEFGKAFSKHENDEVAEKWRKALVKATSFSGWDLSTTANGHEVDFIKLVVKVISSKLPVVFAAENLVGMRTRVNDVISSLNAARYKVCMIGIWGMGGLKSLQQQVLRDVFKRQDIFINGVLDGQKEMKTKMHGIEVLVVLDDVDHINQLKALAGERNWFKKGSVIIITTRDEQVLRSHDVELIQVNLLSNKEALSLFYMNAFGTEIPVQGYEALSREVVSYAAGLPLTITVLGSHLRGRSTRGWKGVLESLKRMPKKEVVDILELSYTSLEDDVKEIFLDVACMWVYIPIDDVVLLLESCGHFEARCGLDVLKEKSLITISNDGEKVVMHDQIVEMGRNIVRRPHRKEPHKHSHLWKTLEIEHVLANDLGTEATECIEYLYGELSSELFMKGLRKMKKLRYLRAYTKSHDGYCFSGDWEFDEVTEYIPSALQCLIWSYYPFSSLPKIFQANNLVTLSMPESEIVQLWEGGEKKILKKLKYLQFRNSKLKTLDLGMTPNLKELWLSRCRDLAELLFPLQCLQLTYIHLSHTKLRTLDLRGAPNLEGLKILCHDDLAELYIPAKWPKLKSFNLKDSKLTTLDLQEAQNLEKLVVRGCDSLEELHIHSNCLKLESIDITGVKLRTFDLALTPNLKRLRLTECSHLVELQAPEDIDLLKCIEELNIAECTILRDIPNSICKMKRLECFHLRNCVAVEKLPEELGRLECLKASRVIWFYIRDTNLRRRNILLRKAMNNIHPETTAEASRMMIWRAPKKRLLYRAFKKNFGEGPKKPIHSKRILDNMPLVVPITNLEQDSHALYHHRYLVGSPGLWPDYILGNFYRELKHAPLGLTLSGPWLLTPGFELGGRYPRPHWAQTNPRQFWAEARLLKHAAPGRSPRTSRMRPPGLELGFTTM
ncbi:hypothetical protein OSB04_015912 [Centaurea solstitialis]|uniref:TIR domain-containing protein n=1 Tax=Centaurea solstitialis TaxID=347529 RepID=A0AA38W9C1_9ASTR|nr:hypothetical protein OSB04_015912 [Centaurea solstitialis]